MPEYRVAQVCFSEGGKAYPVNSKYAVEPGQFVIVRVEGKFTPLQKAKVVSVDYWKGACKHSVVCRAERAEEYGSGPEGVATEEDLDRFLLGFMRMTKCAVVREMPQSQRQYEPHPRWDVAYYSERSFQSVRPDGYGTAGKLVIIGRGELCYRAPDDGQHIWMADGALLADKVGALPLPIRDGNVYRRAAENAEWPLAVDLRPADRSLADIKSVIGGNGYLSDDVYL
ncbi:hypothetical protein J2R99_002493 [Rhodopseudomonas julia]|uniref:Uncharacterized protein n=1 Tax=Rhodopseudomonas julia TaxID=200617 RepID=A0ABU0C7Y0_9BRAD|nr:hypothetical protein [Rhodopseudomonas julia]MDQ0326624.1 hypothetical protein [Rhodopseudomonas julia]